MIKKMEIVKSVITVEIAQEESKINIDFTIFSYII